MKLGAEPKKIAILAGLLTVAGVVFYINVLSSSDPREQAAPTPAPKQSAPKQSATVKQADAPTGPGATAPQSARQSPNISRAKSRIRGNQQEFKPEIGGRDGERPDPSKVDPSLRLDLIAKVQSVEYDPGSRSLFQFAVAPAPPAPKAPPVTIKPTAPAPPPTVVATGPPPEPKAPPIPLKFYGFTTPRRDGAKRAFFLDGEDIVVAAEGETVKRRYKLVRIGVNSVVMSDTQFKNDSQTLPIAPEAT